MAEQNGAGRISKFAGLILVGAISFFLLYQVSVKGPGERQALLAAAAEEIRVSRQEMSDEIRGLRQDLQEIRGESAKQTRALEQLLSCIRGRQAAQGDGGH